MHPETRADTGPRFNALKHGHYAKTTLLPGENGAAFHRERRALFHNFRPQTKDEADLVAAMAKHLWAAKRYDPAQAQFDAQALSPETDAAGRVCEPIAHQRLHSGMDVTVQSKRIDHMWHKARAALMVAQQQRRKGLIAGAVKLPDDCYMETDGSIRGPVPPVKLVPIPEAEIEDQPDSEGVSASADRADGFPAEQKETGSPASAPDFAATPAGVQKSRPITGGMEPGASSGVVAPDEVTAWAAFPGEIIVLGMVEAVPLPVRNAA